jgi:hypothetical protein
MPIVFVSSVEIVLKEEHTHDLLPLLSASIGKPLPSTQREERIREMTYGYVS